MRQHQEPARARAARATPDSSLPSVLAIVVTHNGRAWLKDCLVALNTQTYPVLDVLVLDDASPDTRRQPHLKRVAKRHLRRRRWGYLRTRRPLGYGGAINWAMSRVRTDVDLLLFLHDDVALEPLAVEKMVELLSSDERTAIVGPKIVDWDEPDRLEEVGMAVDQFGYPYKGLEEHEIDLGQHDVASEVFYVTSTCMLMRHELFKDLRGWDAKMRAFTEDLDLCWRARLLGYSVRVEPQAKARHAIAMARGLRKTPYRRTRYYIRRNRFRAIAKNASTGRMLILLPAFILLTLVEMLGFIILRQPREIGNLARALSWNFLTLPQTLADRARAQRGRSVSDSELQRLRVGQLKRARSYITHQADRIEETWGRRAELIAQRVQQGRAFARSLKGITGVIAGVAFLAFLLGFRNILFEPPASVGELLPFPESATALWREFLSPWRNAGLGQANSAPPALAILGVVPLLMLGAAGLAQKVLLLGLGLIAFYGAYSLVAGLVDRPSRLVAGLAYSLGPMGYAGVRTGSLGALVFAAAAPFVVLFMMRLIGWVRPPGWNRARAITRVAVGAAISAAFVPGALVLYGIVAVLLAATRTFLDTGARALRGLTSCVIGLLLAWALLLPWSASWFSEGGPLTLLTDERTWTQYAAGFSGHGAASVLLAQTPDGPVLVGIALVVLAVLAVLVADGQRRKFALALWVVIAVTAWLTTAFGNGSLRPIVASPIEAGVLSAMAFAALAGIAVGGFRLDLPRRGLGLMHALTLGGLGVAVFLSVVGGGPAVLAGAWDPGAGTGAADKTVTSQLTDLLGLEAQQEGAFRTLWVGEAWRAPVGSVARPWTRHMVTNARGQFLTDLFERTSGDQARELRSAIAAVENEETDRGGALLGAFNVSFVVLERSERTRPWLEQRDLAIVRREESYLLLANEAEIIRAGIYDDVPSSVTAIEEGDTQALPRTAPSPSATISPSSPARYSVDELDASGVAVLAESEHPRWQADTPSGRLDRVEAGWANAFEVPAGTDRLTLRFTRTTGDLVWLIVIGFAWLLILAAAASRTRIDRLEAGR